jgi:HlyD family secretion protein
VSTLTHKKEILEEALSFQGDLVHLLEEPLPKGIRSTLYYCVILAVAALLVSIAFKVDVVVQGPGKLTYDAPPIVLQPFEHAVLKTLEVRPGDVVKKGQTLATLDPTFAKADLTSYEDRERILHAQIARMECEANGTPYRADAADGQSGVLQSEIYFQRTTEYQYRIKALTATIEQSEAGLKRIEQEKENLSKQLEIAASIETMQEGLLKAKTNSQLEFLAAKSSRLKTERDFQDATDRLVEKKHELQTAQAQKDSFIQEWRRSLLEDLIKQRSDETQVAAALSKSSKINSMVVITAPADGIVLDIANRSAGSVLRESETLIVLAPTDAPLMTEVELSSTDIGDVAIGDSVLVKVDAFPFQRYGGLEGKIRSISHESHNLSSESADLESVAYKRSVRGGSHRVTVELASNRMPGLPASRNLFPGMTASGEVHVGKRRLINYLLDPLLRGLRESFRET